MYHPRPGLVIGFHGCDLSVCNEVIEVRTSLKPSINNYDWLGSGVYFWENNCQRALEFASECINNKARNDEIRTPSVIGAVLDLGVCLDLLDSDILILLKTPMKISLQDMRSMKFLFQ